MAVYEDITFSIVREAEADLESRLTANIPYLRSGRHPRGARGCAPALPALQT